MTPVFFNKYFQHLYNNRNNIIFVGVTALENEKKSLLASN